MRFLFRFALPLVVLAGCSSVTPSSETSDATATQYVSIVDFGNGANQDAWFGLQSKLKGEFADVCGDTFCGGDYSNLTPLTLSCSVTSKTGSVHDCAWTFAGSLASVDPSTSAISIDSPTFECHVYPKTTAPKLIALLSGSTNALKEPLPGTTGSLYDELVDCFQHPIGKTPVTFSDAPKPTYIDANDYGGAATQAKWQSARAALKLGFDHICGDTFCGSDYGDLQSMELTCSVTASTGNVKECAWVFAGSFALPSRTGALIETSKSFRCHVPVKGTLSQLTTVLNAAGTTDPIQRPLPGGTASAYDALGGCLP